jgi:GH25 family lysozyme M1 (1,4-beta-N-acetylmuramidase)
VGVTGASVLAASALAYADGIDVSHHQGPITWSKVDSAGIGFAFMKATEGATYADPTLHVNWSGAEKEGIYRGAYHFARPSLAAGSAAQQASFYVSKVGSFSDKGDLPPVLDLEATGGLGVTSLTTWVSTWLSAVERSTGRAPIIYVSPSFWESSMGNSTSFHHYPLWVAHYASKPRVPGGWSTWTFWQHTSSGSVSGITGNVDMNIFNGSAARLAVLANSSAASTAPAPPGPTLPSPAATAMTLVPAATTATAGALVRFTGTLTTIKPAAPVRARAVSLWSRATATSTWSRVAAGTTDSVGRYGVRVAVSRAAYYQVRWAGDASYAAARSPIVHVRTTPAPTAITLHASKADPLKGAALTIYGQLSSGGVGTGGLTVRYYKRAISGTTWTYVGSSTSAAATGSHSLVVHPLIARVWKVEYAGGSLFAAARSSYMTVHPR